MTLWKYIFPSLSRMFSSTPISYLYQHIIILFSRYGPYQLSPRKCFRIVLALSCSTSSLIQKIGSQKKIKISLSALPADVLELPKKGIPGNQMNFSFGCTHPVWSQGNQDCIIFQELQDGNSWDLHVELLLFIVIELAFGLMDLQEFENDVLVDVMSDWFLYLLHVEVKLLFGPSWVMGKGLEDLFDQFLRFYLLQEVRDHLIDQVGNDISVLIFPFNPEVQLDILARRDDNLLHLNFWWNNHCGFWRFLFWAGIMLIHSHVLKGWFSGLFKVHLICWDGFLSALGEAGRKADRVREVGWHLHAVHPLVWYLVKVSAVIGHFDERVEIVVVHLNKSTFTFVFLWSFEFVLIILVYNILISIKAGDGSSHFNFLGQFCLQHFFFSSFLDI